MSESQILHNLDDFLSRSRHLLELAGRGNWDEFESLRAKRDVKLNIIGQALEPQVLANVVLIQDVRDRLEDITAINKKLVVLARKSEISAQAQYKDASLAQKAITAYGK